MKSSEIFRYAFDAVRLRKIRSGLTVLGVVVGITAIVALMTISQGYQVAIADTYESGLGVDTLIVSTGRGFGPAAIKGGSSSTTLYENDTETISQVQHVEAVTPILSESCIVTLGNSELILTVTGVDFSVYSSIYSSFEAEQGVIPEDPSGAIAVVGSTFTDPWGNQTDMSIVGDNLDVSWIGMINGTTTTKNTTLSIVGILPEIGSGSSETTSAPNDYGIYVSIEFAMEFFETDIVNSFIVKVDDPDDAVVEYVSERISDVLDEGVSVQRSTAFIDLMTESLATTESLLIGIAGISLLVAGIGIMNIMIVSLMERTREIGIMKALGTKSRTIMASFLGEAIIIGLIGSIIGIVFGYTVASLFAEYGGDALFGGAMSARMLQNISYQPVMSLEIMFGSLGFGVLVSVIFGLYPAWRASRLTPVKSLKSE
ncbi:MAG: ABC transporter permease [Candidatus Thorarchaeota archaeon]|jgi:putative ABC transport system permease protein